MAGKCGARVTAPRCTGGDVAVVNVNLLTLLVPSSTKSLVSLSRFVAER